MKATTVLKVLGPIDIKSVKRDSLLAWMIIIPIFEALLIRWLLPPIENWMTVRFDLDLKLYYPLIMSYIVLICPVFFGVVIGFLLLDERDDHTLTALQVTPLPMTGYLAYRLFVPIIISLIVTLICFPIAGLGIPPLKILLPVTLLAALEAPIMALALFCFAENKVAGFAFMKVMGALQMAPLVAYFISPPWQWLTGVIPTYWPVKVLWLSEQGASGGGQVEGRILQYQSLNRCWVLQRIP